MVEARAEGRHEDAEIVRSRGECWLGEVRIAPSTLTRLIALTAVSGEEGGGCERFALNSTGAAIAADPGLADAVAAALAAGRPFTIVDGGVRELPSDGWTIRERRPREEDAEEAGTMTFPGPDR